jgi:hypothetical protein
MYRLVGCWAFDNESRQKDVLDAKNYCELIELNPGIVPGPFQHSVQSGGMLQKNVEMASRPEKPDDCIEDVIPQSSAEATGVKVGDIITSGRYSSILLR